MLSYFDLLPLELISEIFAYINYVNLLQLKDYHQDDNRLWYKKLHIDYPDFNIENVIDYDKNFRTHVIPTKKFEIACNNLIEDNVGFFYRYKEYKKYNRRAYGAR